MQELITETSDLVTITPAAAAKVRELLAAEGNPELALRVYVAGGGCSGLQYGMALDDSVMEGDTLHLTQPTEAATGIQKEMLVTMDRDAPHVRVLHRFRPSFECGSAGTSCGPGWRAHKSLPGGRMVA